MRYLKLLAAALVLTACGKVDYPNLPAGTFTGSLFVMWVSDNDTREGAGRFVFVPNPRSPLTFTRTNPDATLTVIQPEMMYTDGGSIPRAVQVFNGFSPWAYAPAYMVHDWLFVARHCVTDDNATSAEAAIADMPFIESAHIIGEAIRTLIEAGRVQPNDVAPPVISGTVAGPISHKRWVAKGACEADRVTPKHAAEARAGIPSTARSGLFEPLVITDPDTPYREATPARIVTEISF